LSRQDQILVNLPPLAIALLNLDEETATSQIIDSSMPLAARVARGDLLFHVLIAAMIAERSSMIAATPWPVSISVGGAGE
jgi:hypothetical protein